MSMKRQFSMCSYRIGFHIELIWLDIFSGQFKFSFSNLVMIRDWYIFLHLLCSHGAHFWASAGTGHMATQVRMSKWLLKLWLHKQRSPHFVWEMTFHWQWYLRGLICFMIISSNALHRFVRISCLCNLPFCMTRCSAWCGLFCDVVCNRCITVAGNHSLISCLT